MIMYGIITALAAPPPGDVLVAAHGLLPVYHVPSGGGNALVPGDGAAVPSGGGSVGGGGRGSGVAAHVKRPNEVC